MKERTVASKDGLVRTLHCMAVTFAVVVAQGGQPIAVEAQERDAGVKFDAARVSEPATDAPLRVGYVGSAPFVDAEAPPKGLAIGVWEQVAERAKQPFELRRMANVPDALSAVSRSDLDVAIGPISITSTRAAHVDFTQPYFQAEIGILAAEASTGMWGRLAPFLARVFAGASLLLALTLLGVGTLIWAVERRKNPEHFPSSPVKGIGNGIWFALVTMTTVGYGDRSPTTLTGRIVTGLWMLVALVTTSSLTAGVASAFTILQLDHGTIESAADMRGETVGVVRGATAAAFARSNGARLETFGTLEAAAKAAEDGDVAAVVHDRPMLRHYLKQEPDSPLKLVSAAYQPQGYGFAVAPARVKLLRQLDVALLSIQEDGSLSEEIERWLGAQDTE